MRKEKIKSNYGKLSDDELVVIAGKIAGALTDNVYFADSEIDMDQLQSAVDDYRQKKEIAVNGGSLYDKRVKNQSRTHLLYVLSQLAFYVNKIGNGVLPVLTSSGMILSKKPSGTQVPYVIERVILKDGAISGQMKVSFTSQRSVWDYEIQIGTWPEEEVDIVWGESYLTTTSRGTIIASLSPGMRYYVRVRARNSKGIGDWTASYPFIVR